MNQDSQWGGGGGVALHWGLCCTELTLHGRALGTLRTPAVLWCRRAESSAQARPEAGSGTCTPVKTPVLAPSPAALPGLHCPLGRPVTVRTEFHWLPLASGTGRCGKAAAPFHSPGDLTNMLLKRAPWSP